VNSRWIFPLILVSGFAYLVVAFHDVLLPFVLAATAAYVLNPLIVILESRGIRRERAVMVVYTVLLCTVIGFAYLAVTAAIQSTAAAAVEMPGYVQKARSIIGKIEQIPWLQRLSLTEVLQHQVLQDGRSWVFKVIEAAPELIRTHILPLLELSFLVPFLTYFFMLDGPWFLQSMLDFVPSRHVEMFLNVIVEIDSSFGNYLRGLLLQSLFMGLMAGIGYGVIGLRYVVYISIWVALSSMVPFLGPISAALTGAIVALFQWGTVLGLVKVLAVYVVIRTMDDWVLQPQILRRAVHIHPVITSFALLAGAYAAGLWGLLFAVPVVCMLKVLLEVSLQWYRVENGLTPKAIPPEISQIPIV
jgi:predicted PurR-regulated permease PerM